MPRRRLYQIERLIVREATDLWCKEQSFYCDNFAADVEVDVSKKRITVSFGNTARMQHGLPEATVNELMRGLILTMAADARGRLLPDYAVIVKNILDVFFHRLLEIADKKFIYQRLQSLELGFGILFGLGADFFPLRAERRMLEEILTSVSLSSRPGNGRGTDQHYYRGRQAGAARTGRHLPHLYGFRGCGKFSESAAGHGAGQLHCAAGNPYAAL